MKEILRGVHPEPAEGLSMTLSSKKVLALGKPYF